MNGEPARGCSRLEPGLAQSHLPLTRQCGAVVHPKKAGLAQMLGFLPVLWSWANYNFVYFFRVQFDHHFRCLSKKQKSGSVSPGSAQGRSSTAALAPLSLLGRPAAPASSRCWESSGSLARIVCGDGDRSLRGRSNGGVPGLGTGNCCDSSLWTTPLGQDEGPVRGQAGVAHARAHPLLAWCPWGLDKFKHLGSGSISPRPQNFPDQKRMGQDTSST